MKQLVRSFWLKSFGRFTPGFRRAGVILMYHRIAEVAHDPWGICVSPANFNEHVQVLHRCRCVSLTQIVAGEPAGRRIAVTFDDGYADNLYAAIPALERADVPATFFITTGGIGVEREFWWDELQRLIFDRATPARIEFSVGDSVHTFDRDRDPTTKQNKRSRLPLPRASSKDAKTSGRAG